MIIFLIVCWKNRKIASAIKNENEIEGTGTNTNLEPPQQPINTTSARDIEGENPTNQQSYTMQ